MMRGGMKFNHLEIDNLLHQRDEERYIAFGTTWTGVSGKAML